MKKTGSGVNLPKTPTTRPPKHATTKPPHVHSQKENLFMGRLLDELQSWPVFEFIGGPLDGCKLPINIEQHPDTLRVTFEPDNGPAMTDVYARDVIENKFRFDRRDVAVKRETHGGCESWE
jgi:hypothetical protein